MPDETDTETETETEAPPTDATDTTEPAEPEAQPAREPDPLRDPLLESLEQDLGEALLGSDIARDDIVVRVERSAWRRAAELLKTKHGFDYFCFLSGIDWMPSVDLATRHEKIWDDEGDAVAEVADAQPSGPWETGRAGGSTRFQVFARLYSIERKFGITLKADLDDTDPSVDSWVQLFRGADWHEREAWEMFGFDFAGHPGLRHLYLPGEFEGNPMRKDFPLLAREVKPWPGLVDKEPIPGEGDEPAEEPAEADS